MENSKSVYSGLLALFVGAALLGLSAIFVRFSETSPSLTAFYRAFLALPFLYIWVLRTKTDYSLTNYLTKENILVLMLAGIFFGTDMAIWNWSISFTSVAHATLMANTAPIFVTLISFFFLKEKIKSSFFSALILSFLGVNLVILSGSGADSFKLLGDGLGLIAAVFYAAYILAIKKLTNSLPPAHTLFFATVFTAIFLFPVGLLESESLFPKTKRGWIVLLAYAFVSQSLAQGLITLGISRLSAHVSSLTLLIQPVAAAIYGWLILSESLNLWQALGGLIVLAGIYLATREQD
ncbi:MAG: EamA family transporter [Gammaproteobacteria bacterium]|nr:EamA family transporter [Gammaproteobacteria bacterium]|tara:strand:+ start:59 stop:940 length:882 start_codon:yes stop_codon:yes gene_type:complete